MAASSPQGIVSKFGTGCNLGLFFETVGHDRSSATVSPLISALHSKGFGCIRIPVTWYPASLAGACVLNDSTFMGQLDNAIYYTVSLGMGVILDAHFETWLYDTYDGTSAYDNKFYALWLNIANRYSSIAQNALVFEILNEPQLALGDFASNNFNNSTTLALCRQIIAVGFNAVRAVSATRVVVLPVNAFQSIAQLSAVYPTASSFPGGGQDQYLMVAFHSYVPVSFCSYTGLNSVYLNQIDAYGALKAQVDGLLDQVVAWKASLYYPSLGIALTEFGAGDSQNTGRRNSDIVRAYYRCTALGCVARGIMPVVWNDCSQTSYYGMSTLPSETAGVVQFQSGLADALLRLS